MKKCPSCQKTYEDDNLKFCQKDGTALVVVAAEGEANDPYATMVGNQSDISEILAEQDKKKEAEKSEPEPEADPYQTIVAGSPLTPEPESKPAPELKEEEPENEDVLEIPDEKVDDPMKTMVITGNTSDNIKVNIPDEEPKDEAPVEIPEPPKQQDFEAPSPEPPKFTEPNVELPDLNESSTELNEPKVEEKSEPTPVDSVSAPVEPKIESAPVQDNLSSDEIESDDPSSPSVPIPSPFDQSMPPGYAPPSTPPFEPPKEDLTPEPLNESVESKEPPKSPFAEPEPQAEVASKAEELSDSANDWSPPPAPMQEFEGKDIGENTPFDTPPTGEGENKTLAIVSLVCGVLSMLCCISIITGPAGIITGYMAKNNINENPSEYGGATFATIGMITGGIGVVLFIVLLILQVVFGALGSF